jgi:hypothetical protein
VVDNSGNNYIIETKGFNDEDAENKKERAIEWCSDVSNLFGESWEYVYVHQLVFEKHYWSSFRHLKEEIERGEQTLESKVAEDAEKFES